VAHEGRDEQIMSRKELDDLESVGSRQGLEPGIGLCLSGGGYRAMLFHLGALWRLNDLSYLPRLDRISSVSGGSIVAGILGLAWKRLDFTQGGRATNFDQEVVAPIRAVSSRTIDWPAVAGGLLPASSPGNRLAAAYRRHLFGGATLEELPDRPRFVFLATNLQSGVLWRITKDWMWDYYVGQVVRPQTELALAVAASSAFPPFLSPVVLRFAESDFVPDTGMGLQHPPYTTRVMLTDGGVYDNLGIEVVWNRYQTVLMSDGSGGSAKPRPHISRNWAFQSKRILDVITPRLPLLQSRQVVDAFAAGIRNGTYWGTRSNIDDYELPDALPCRFERTRQLGEIRTRLRCLSEITQKALINWGYAVCDAAMRKHVAGEAEPPDGFPYPDVPLV